MVFAAVIFLTTIFPGVSGIQTDWSGGSGQPGPVEQWTDFYNQNNNADHDTPGEVTIQPTGEASGFLPYQAVLQGIDEVYSIDAADLNDDGLVDVALASYSGEIWVCLQNGGGSWTEIEVADPGYSISALSLADFDGDGKDDIAVCLYDHGDILWYRNPLPGGSTWESHIVHQSVFPREALPVDMDDDGDPDILCASEGQGVFICWNQDGTGTSWSVEMVDPSLLPAHNAAAADMDNDGTMDVIVSGGEAGGIFMYTAPLWTRYTVADSVGVIEDIACGELNEDSFNDIAAISLTDYRTNVYENPGDPLEEWTVSPVGNQKGICLILSDIDQDGDIDLISSSPTYDYLSVSLKGETGGWLIYQSDIGMNGFSDMALADIDGSFPLDLVGASYFDGTAAWCEGALQTTYHSSATITSSILHCDSLDQLFPLFLEVDFQGTASMRFRASGDLNAMGQWSGELGDQIEEVSSFIQPGDTYCQYLVTLYSLGDFIPSTLYEIELTSSPTGTGTQGVPSFAVVSPNPAPGATVFRFFLESPAPVSLMLFDLGGRLIRELGGETYPPGENGMILNDLSPGLYLLRASIDGEPHSVKLVVTEGR